MLKVEPVLPNSASSDSISSEDITETVQSKLILKGHRDELAALETAFSQADVKDWAQLERWEG